MADDLIKQYPVQTVPPVPGPISDLPVSSGSAPPATPKQPSLEGTPTPTQPLATGSTPLFSGVSPPASPGLTVPSTTQQGAAPAPAPTPEIKPLETVQGQLSDLFTNKDVNPLFEYAQGQAMQYANTRGLLNSDIAAEAGTQAVFANALQIAGQDAATYSQAARQAQGHVERMVELAKQGDINSKLQLEQFGYNFELSEQQNIHNLQLAAFQGDVQASLALQQFGFDTELMAQDYGYRITLQNNELANAMSLAGQAHQFDLENMAVSHQYALEQIAANVDTQFAANLQMSYLAATENRTTQFSAEVQTILSTEGLTPEQQQYAVDVARRNYLRDIQNYQAFYMSNPSWNPEWAPNMATTPQQGSIVGYSPPVQPTQPNISGPAY